MSIYKSNLPHNPRKSTRVKVSLTVLAHPMVKAHRLTPMHRIHADLQLARPGQQTFDGIKVKDGPKEIEIDIHGVHYLH